MCCFSRPVQFVGATRIFARAEEGGRQLLAYSMDVEIDEELAMVLPLPVALRCGDDAVRFVDLQGYDRFFVDLSEAFPPDYSSMPQAKGRSRGPAKPATLVVHDVGLFEASFVPTVADFARLDARFRMPDGVWSGLPQYENYGFAVFRLKPKKKGLLGFGSTRQRIHPMALSFPRHDERALFFPTVHVHEGAMAPKANFDHMLYCQADGLLDATLDWTRSNGALGAKVSVERAKGLVDGAREGRRAALWGPLDNRDVVLRAPDGVTVADLSGRGESYAFTARATAAYSVHDGLREPWKQTAREKLPALCAALAEGLRAITESKREAWALTALDASLPQHFMNGVQLWSGTDYTNGARAEHGGPGRLAMRIFSEQFEPQDITLAFARLPDPQRLSEIAAALTSMIERAVI